MQKYFIILVICVLASSLRLSAQSAQTKESEPTKQQALDYLKNILVGQVKHYQSGDPLENVSGSTAFLPSYVEIVSVNLVYDLIEVKILAGKEDRQVVFYKTSLKNEFEVYEHCICTIKDETAPVPKIPRPYEASKRYKDVFICFDDNSSIMDKALNAMLFLRKFTTKDPFEK